MTLIIKKKLKRTKSSTKKPSVENATSQLDFFHILSAITEHVVYHDIHNRILWANKSAGDSIGVDPEQLIGEYCYQVWHKRKEPCAGCPIVKALKTKQKQTADITTPDGRVWLIWGYPVIDTDGNVEGLIEITQEITERKKAENALMESRKELQNKTLNLEELNTALKVLLQKRQEDNMQGEEKVMMNISELVKPYLEKLKNEGLNRSQKIYVDIIESNLEEIISSFTVRLSSSHLNLTPSEIKVANLVKQGKTNKEIAALLNVSSRTAAFHRERIRKKLGLKNKKTNLRSYLLSIK